MGNTVCFVNQKGGTGKTSLILNVACVFAMEMGKRVLLIDGDGQASLTTGLGFDPDTVSPTIASLLVERNAHVEDYVIDTGLPNLAMIASNQETFAAEYRLHSRTGREFVLNDALEPVRENWDLVLIDTPPNLGMFTINAVVASHGIVIVYTASEFALDGIAQVLNLVDEIQADHRLNPNGVRVLGAIQNRYRAAARIVNAKAREAMEGIAEVGRLFKPMMESTAIERSQFAHQPMVAFRPSHKVTQQLRSFAQELAACLD